MTSRLAQAIEFHVQTAVEETIARRAGDAGEEMARELLREPEFRDEMRTLLRAAFKRALLDLTAPEPPDGSGFARPAGWALTLGGY